MIAVPDALKGRDFTRVADFSGAELEVVLDLAERMKAAGSAGSRVYVSSTSVTGTTSARR